MNKLFSALLLIALSTTAYAGSRHLLGAPGTIVIEDNVQLADVYVNGYFKGNGAYVAPHYRSSPDGNPYNNYGYGR